MTPNNDSTMGRRLSSRVAGDLPDNPPVNFGGSAVAEGLCNYLRDHLAAGETHYTARPGIPELRAAIGHELERLGVPARDADGVIVTHGEGEALYVSLLGLGASTNSTIATPVGCRHSELLELLKIEVINMSAQNVADACVIYREFGGESGDGNPETPDGVPEILGLGGLLYSKDSTHTPLPPIDESTILIGHLDSLPGLDHFRLGFVAGPPETVKRIQTWKQALSICSAGPSQRAALFAIGEEVV